MTKAERPDKPDIEAFIAARLADAILAKAVAKFFLPHKGKS